MQHLGVLSGATLCHIFSGGGITMIHPCQDYCPPCQPVPPVPPCLPPSPLARPSLLPPIKVSSWPCPGITGYRHSLLPHSAPLPSYCLLSGTLLHLLAGCGGGRGREKREERDTKTRRRDMMLSIGQWTRSKGGRRKIEFAILQQQIQPADKLFIGAMFQ